MVKWLSFQMLVAWILLTRIYRACWHIFLDVHTHIFKYAWKFQHGHFSGKKIPYEMLSHLKIYKDQSLFSKKVSKHLTKFCNFWKYVFQIAECSIVNWRVLGATVLSFLNILLTRTLDRDQFWFKCSEES